MASSTQQAHWAYAIWLPLSLLGAWQWAASAGWLDPLFFPPPSRLAQAAVRHLLHGDLALQVYSTLARSFLGFAAGTLAGLLCGAAMGLSTRAHRSLEPLVSALYSTPKITLLPMLMLLVGVGETSRLLIIAAGCFILVAMHTLDGIASVDPHYVDMARNCGASRHILFRRVYLPACTPHVFTGMRLAAGRGLVTTLSVEMVSAGEGLGNVILHSWQTFSTERLYLAIILTALLGASLHQSLRALEKRLIPWRKK